MCVLAHHTNRFEYEGHGDGRSCRPGVGAALLLLAEKYKHVRDALLARPVSLPFSAACTGEALASILANGNNSEQDFDRYTPNWEYPQVVPPEGVDAVRNVCERVESSVLFLLDFGAL